MRLLAVICDPDNAFEWVGVLREVFGISDAVIASSFRDGMFPGTNPPTIRSRSPWR